MQTKTKYIHIRHWDYWWATYQLLEQDKPDSVEFSITNDKEGEDLFFHFDFYNLPALQNMMDADEYMERENPDYPVFEQKVEALKTGKLDYFVGSLYYPAFFPRLEFCNQPFAGERRFLTQRLRLLHRITPFCLCASISLLPWKR